MRKRHYFIATIVSANGNLDFATGLSDSVGHPKPKAYPMNAKRSEQINPHYPGPGQRQVYRHYHVIRTCHHPSCETISHDTYCDGSTPKWESHLVLNLLTPGVLMAPLLEETRSVVLASGSLAPLESLCAELHLLPPIDNHEPCDKKFPLSKDSDELLQDEVETNQDPLSTTSGRLQIAPKPLEANHVVDLPKQLLALGIGHFPDGTSLKVTKVRHF